jgi:hypothetical protein
VDILADTLMKVFHVEISLVFWAECVPRKCMLEVEHGGTCL